jgi:hypothetical protein
MTLRSSRAATSSPRRPVRDDAGTRVGRCLAEHDHAFLLAKDLNLAAAGTDRNAGHAV